MVTERIEIEVPKGITQFALLKDEKSLQKRNAMLVYPFIQNGTISHGRAARVLGMFKIDLIKLYGEMGLPYLDESREEIEEELEALERVCGKA